MDTTALSLCMDNHLPIYVFELAEGNIERIVAGERVGTLISTPTAGSAAGRAGGARPKNQRLEAPPALPATPGRKTREQPDDG